MFTFEDNNIGCSPKKATVQPEDRPASIDLIHIADNKEEFRQSLGLRLENRAA